MDKQIRRFSAPLDIQRAESENDYGILEGYFITYNSPAPCGNYDFFEMVDPAALTETLQREQDIKCFYNHNYDLILGRQSNNTLRLSNDEKGLWGLVQLNLNDSQARDVFERVKRGDITGCSFGAYVEDEDMTEDEDGRTIFVLKKLNLLEVSVCPLPFYESTTMEARSKMIESKRLDEIKLQYLKKRCTTKWL